MRQQLRFTEIDTPFIERDKAEIAVLPVAYDKTTTWIKGADKGPFAILEASQALELYDIETDSEVYKKGIYTCPVLKINSSPEKMVKKVHENVLKLIDGNKFVVLIGGEHSVSVGSVKAHLEKYKDMTVLQMDAHADLRNEYMGTPYNHACSALRIKEMCPLVQVGIRSMDIEEKKRLEPNSVFFAGEMLEGDNYMGRLLGRLSENIYVTIDLDVFDPSIMPSTGTPEPGGLNWYDVTGILRTVSQRKNIIGFDVVELCPNKSNKAPDFLAAKLIYKFLSYIYSSRG